MIGEGAISRLAISQASVKHSGIYTCAVSDNISQSLRLHIIDGKYTLKKLYCIIVFTEQGELLKNEPHSPQLVGFFAEFSLLMYIWHLAFYGNTNESNKVRGIALQCTGFMMPSNSEIPKHIYTHIA